MAWSFKKKNGGRFEKKMVAKQNEDLFFPGIFFSFFQFSFFSCSFVCGVVVSYGGQAEVGPLFSSCFFFTFSFFFFLESCVLRARFIRWTKALIEL